MEGKSSLSSLEKRSDPVPESGSPKKAKKKLPLTVPPGHVSFRILCPATQVPDFIGSLIRHLQKSTESKIRVEKAPKRTRERVILIIGRVCSTARVKLGEEEEEIEVSKPQEALIRVFETLIKSTSSGTVSCRLLVEARYTGALDCDCEVIIRRDHLPNCANPHDALVQIGGNVLAVKKALVSISSCLQVSQSNNKERVIGGRFVGTPASKNQPVTNSQKLVLKILCPTDGVIGHGGITIKAIRSATGAFIDVVTPAGCDEFLIAVAGSKDAKDPAQRAFLLVFSELCATEKFLGSVITARLVVSTSQIGRLTGKGGSVVSEMQEKSGASIQILDVEKNPKWISEKDQGVEISGNFLNVKAAIYHVTDKLRGELLHNSRKNSATKSKDSDIPGRISHGEATNTGAIGFHPSSTPSLTMSTCLHRRSQNSNLADLDIRAEDTFYNRYSPSAEYAPNFGPQSTMDLNDISHHSSEAPYPFCVSPWPSPPPAAPRGVYDESEGLSSAMADLRLDSEHRSSSVATNTTVEIGVSEAVVNFLCEEKDANGQILLRSMRQILGAKVIVHEPYLGRSDRIISITGTPDQIQTAQFLLASFDSDN